MEENYFRGCADAKREIMKDLMEERFKNGRRD